jgi:hypothetical protein
MKTWSPRSAAAFQKGRKLQRLALNLSGDDNLQQTLALIRSVPEQNLHYGAMGGLDLRIAQLGGGEIGKR